MSGVGEVARGPVGAPEPPQQLGNFTDKAIDLIKKATQADQEGHYDEALRHYENALQCFLLALKHERNQATEDTIRQRCAEYFARAEMLKEFLANNAPQKKALIAGGGTATKKGGKPEEDAEDGETQKLRAMLSSIVLVTKPNVPWAAVAGLEEAKEALKEAVILPLKFPKLFTGARKPWKGILLYGPPGTGKSYLAQAVATEAKSTFFSVSSSDLVSKFQGESERLVRLMFQMAREQRPSIIFIDEVDSLCSARTDSDSESSRRIKTEFLVQMDGVGKDLDGVLILGATNIPWALDAGVRRRFEKRVYIGLPDAMARMEMFPLNIGTTPTDLTSDDYQTLAENTEGFSGADIKILVREALMQPVRRLQQATHFKEVIRADENGDPKTFYTACSPGEPGARELNWMNLDSDSLLEPVVTIDDMAKSLRTVKPTVSASDLVLHQQYAAKFGAD
jgi:vacuolar protein-sorting-associated protein 4